LRKAAPSVEPDTLNGPTRGRPLQKCETVVNKFGGLGCGGFKGQSAARWRRGGLLL